MTMTATGYQQATGHDCCLARDNPDECSCRCHENMAGLTDLLAALAPFLQCEAGAKGGACWPRCDGPERRALAAAVKRVREGDQK